MQIMRYKLLHELISVDFANQAARIVMVCDVSGVFGKKIADNLVNRVVPLFLEGIINSSQNALHLGIFVVYETEFSSSIEHLGCLLSIV